MNTQPVPEDFRLVYSREQIAARVKELGTEISEWMHLTLDARREQVLAVCVLNGAAFFFADLLRQIDMSVEPTFCRAESFSTDANQSQGKGVRVAVESVHPQGRHVLLIDDICDTGLTLFKLHNVFLELGARSIRSAVLIHREVEASKYEPTWSAFTYRGSEWFAGYGFEDAADRSRNLPDVYAFTPTPK